MWCWIRPVKHLGICVIERILIFVTVVFPEFISACLLASVSHISLIYIIYIYSIINIIYITIYITFMICLLLNPNRKGDFTLDRMEAECRGGIAFFCSCTCVKVLLTDIFLKCRFRWKVEIISTFPLWTNVAFFLNQAF